MGGGAPRVCIAFLHSQMCVYNGNGIHIFLTYFFSGPVYEGYTWNEKGSVDRVSTVQNTSCMYHTVYSVDRICTVLCIVWIV